MTDWKARAEAAEARVKELESRVKELEARPKVFCAMLTTGVCDLPKRIKELERVLRMSNYRGLLP